jgi:hypothetical protein
MQAIHEIYDKCFGGCVQEGVQKKYISAVARLWRRGSRHWLGARMQARRTKLALRKSAVPAEEETITRLPHGQTDRGLGNHFFEL